MNLNPNLPSFPSKSPHNNYYYPKHIHTHTTINYPLPTPSLPTLLEYYMSLFNNVFESLSELKQYASVIMWFEEMESTFKLPGNKTSLKHYFNAVYQYNKQLRNASSNNNSDDNCNDNSSNGNLIYDKEAASVVNANFNKVFRDAHKIQIIKKDMNLCTLLLNALNVIHLPMDTDIESTTQTRNQLQKNATETNTITSLSLPSCKSIVFLYCKYFN